MSDIPDILGDMRYMPFFQRGESGDSDEPFSYYRGCGCVRPGPPYGKAYRG